MDYTLTCPKAETAAQGELTVKVWSTAQCHGLFHH